MSEFTITDIEPLPNDEWLVWLDNKDQLIITGREINLPEGDYHVKDDLPLYYRNQSVNGLFQFVYIEFGTGSLKIHDANILEAVENKLIEIS